MKGRAVLLKHTCSQHRWKTQHEADQNESINVFWICFASFKLNFFPSRACIRPEVGSQLLYAAVTLLSQSLLTSKVLMLKAVNPMAMTQNLSVQARKRREGKKCQS